MEAMIAALQNGHRQMVAFCPGKLQPMNPNLRFVAFK
jgi:hypothetical protein